MNDLDTEPPGLPERPGPPEPAATTCPARNLDPPEEPGRAMDGTTTGYVS